MQPLNEAAQKATPTLPASNTASQTSTPAAAPTLQSLRVDQGAVTTVIDQTDSNLTMKAPLQSSSDIATELQFLCPDRKYDRTPNEAAESAPLTPMLISGRNVTKIDMWIRAL